MELYLSMDVVTLPAFLVGPLCFCNKLPPLYPKLLSLF